MSIDDARRQESDAGKDSEILHRLFHLSLLPFTKQRQLLPFPSPPITTLCPRSTVADASYSSSSFDVAHGALDDSAVWYVKDTRLGNTGIREDGVRDYVKIIEAAQYRHARPREIQIDLA